MTCPGCKSSDTGVYKTTDDGSQITRQRACKACKGRWMSRERVITGSYVVITGSLMVTNDEKPVISDPPITTAQIVLISNSKNLSRSESGSDQAPSKPSGARAMEPPVFRGLRLSARDSLWDVPADLDRKLEAAFPHINRQQEYAKADAWLVANPTKRKTSRGMPKFLFGWFERNQNRGAALPIQQRETFDQARRRETEDRRVDSAVRTIDEYVPAAFGRKS